ncbi:DET1 [Chionoecetes opilio]|uniref:DET1 n=1 Tax=Chionoecetes opilio TaxID=41210 RepID=A0A8J4XS57_CHIOP|nr:DET1 [Chionoecetes opilio]
MAAVIHPQHTGCGLLYSTPNILPPEQTCSSGVRRYRQPSTIIPLGSQKMFYGLCWISGQGIFEHPCPGVASAQGKGAAPTTSFLPVVVWPRADLNDLTPKLITSTPMAPSRRSYKVANNTSQGSQQHASLESTRYSEKEIIAADEMLTHAARETAETMTTGDEPGIPVNRIPAQNLVVRLFHREIHKNSQYQAHANRSFYQNIAPNFTVTNVQKPPCFLRKFSPDGRQRYFSTWTVGRRSILHWCESGAVLKENDPKTHEIRRNIFDRFFRLKHTVSVATNGEQLNRECSLFTDDGKYGFLACVRESETARHFTSETMSRDPNPPSPWRIHVLWDKRWAPLSDSPPLFSTTKSSSRINPGLYLTAHPGVRLSKPDPSIYFRRILEA